MELRVTKICFLRLLRLIHKSKRVLHLIQTEDGNPLIANFHRYDNLAEFSIKFWGHRTTFDVSEMVKYVDNIETFKNPIHLSLD